jgi:trigger factor
VLPDLDDEFATTASEFDTLDELKAEIRERATRMKRLEQGLAARDSVLEALLDLVDAPIPDSAVDAEVEGRLHQMGHELENIGQTLDSYLALQGKSREEFDAEIRAGALSSVKASFVLDEIATKEELGVSQEELTDQVVRRAQRSGMDPQSYANQLMSSNQLPLLMSEIIRGKALALVLEHAVVTDTDGVAVDLNALGVDVPPAVHDHEGHDHEGHDHEGHDHEGHDHEGHDHEGHDHEGHDHEGHDHQAEEPVPAE